MTVQLLIAAATASVVKRGARNNYTDVPFSNASSNVQVIEYNDKKFTTRLTAKKGDYVEKKSQGRLSQAIHPELENYYDFYYYGTVYMSTDTT